MNCEILILNIIFECFKIFSIFALDVIYERKIRKRKRGITIDSETFSITFKRIQQNCTVLCAL